jgi:hypothetical protein
LNRSQQAFRLRVIQAGVGVTVALAAAAALYLALTWDREHRVLLAVIISGAAIDASVIWFFRRRLARSPYVNVLFAGWNVVHILAAVLASLLDGRADSPFTLILFVSVAFAAVSLERRYVVGIAALDLVALIGVAALLGQWHGSLAFAAPALVTIAAVCATIAEERQDRLDAIQDARAEMLRRLARVIEIRDNETGEHIDRIGAYSALIAKQMGWSDADAERLRTAAPLHDVGKVAVPDRILLKPGPLTDDERREMQRHTVVGHDMLAESSSDDIELAAVIALSHHERFDGSGYPQGHGGSDIPIAGRIVAVADVFDALTSDRVYRPAISVSDALRYMADGRGSHFDPHVLDAFERALDEILSVRCQHAATGRSYDEESPGLIYLADEAEARRGGSPATNRNPT